ncbi:Putative Hypoxanthine phosphoribosyltransferase [Rhizopus microsporus]|nr:Putative Hypoxanthine phosphoribosyltransferase [Rhizopus microsporus]
MLKSKHRNLPMDPKDWIDVTTEKNHYSLNHFVIPHHYEKDVSSILIPHGVIMDRVNKLARLIVAETTGPLVVCCILKGGHQYFADLINAVKKLTNKEGKTVPLSLEFLRVKSYKNDTSEGVTMSITDEECRDFKGKNLLIVEDIIDTGNTMKHINLNRFESPVC